MMLISLIALVASAIEIFKRTKTSSTTIVDAAATNCKGKAIQLTRHFKVSAFWAQALSSIFISWELS